MTKFNFEWKGTDIADLEHALDIARKQVAEGYVQGFDSSEDGRYSYRIIEEES